jgi:dihydrofolate synthase / folylpolyglutamate synthase
MFPRHTNSMFMTRNVAYSGLRGKDHPGISLTIAGFLYYSIGMRYSTFDEACIYMESQTNLAKSMNYTVRTYRLDRMQALLDHFDHPERDVRMIHVAGSKGKGSTALYIAKGLTALGYRTGLYSSPHVSTYRERFTLSGMFFDDHFLLSTAEDMLSHIETFSFEEDYGYAGPTTFEMLTLLSFLLFSRSECDYAVIETGLGGRLDATNVITPVMSVITPIELEHTAILGDTIELIAAEKAGIIKPGVPVTISGQRPQALEVFTRRARQLECPFTLLTDELTSLESSTSAIGEDTQMRWKDGTCDSLLLAMRGSFQAENAALAILVLRKLGLFHEQHSLPAIARASIPGRLELIREHPCIYIDGAHTENSIERVFASFREIHPRGGVLIFGAVEGKNHLRMAELAIEHFQKIVISTPGTFKKSDPEALFQLFSTLLAARGSELPEIQLFLVPSPTDALDKAVALTDEHRGVILTAGSFYMAAEIRNLVCGHESV